MSEFTHPHTQDVLKYVYPYPEIQAGFEELVALYKNEVGETLDIDFLDEIYDSKERKSLTRRIRKANKEQMRTLDSAVNAIIEHGAEVAERSQEELDFSDYVEYLFQCAGNKGNGGSHNYQRRALVSVGFNEQAPNPRQIQIGGQNILYAHGDETIIDGNLYCGTCGDQTQGEVLSRAVILRDDVTEKERDRRIKQTFKDAYEAIRTRKGLSKSVPKIAKTTFESMVDDCISRDFPNIKSPSGAIANESLYEVLENVARHNIPVDKLLDSLPDELLEPFLGAVYKNIPVPAFALRYRMKRDFRLASKIMKFWGKEGFYKESDKYGPRKNPIYEPNDNAAVRPMFATEEQCYDFFELVKKDDRFEIIDKYTKDRIANPKGKFKSLQFSAWYREKGYEPIVIEFQCRTHEMDAAAEYSDDDQTHDDHEQTVIRLNRQVHPIFVEPLVHSTMAPTTYKEWRKNVGERLKKA